MSKTILIVEDEQAIADSIAYALRTDGFAPRHVMLTPVGHDIAERSRRILSDVDQLKETARRSRDPEAGTVRLGIFPTY